MSGDDDYEIPESGAVFTFGRSRFAENVSSHFFVRNDPVVEISCGDEHTALVCRSGRVFLFGRNDYGQLGFGHNKIVSKPSCLKYLKPFHSTHVACGKGHTIVSTACNRLFTFGSNSDGQLGIGDLIDRVVPQILSINLSDDDNIAGVSAGCHHSACVTERGSLYLWGSNSDGQCGVPGETQLITPQKIDFDAPITSVSCGYYHTAFISLGRVYTFGEQDNGKLGLGPRKENVSTPERVDLEENCVLVKCGGSHTLVLTEDGTVHAFGSNFSGQLGIGNFEAECSRATPVEFPGKDDTVVYMSCGESHTAFVTKRGALYTCGDSRYGKLCNEDDSNNYVSPTPIALFENYFCTSVSCGGCHTMVLARNQTSENGTELFPSKNRDVLPPLKIQKDISLFPNAAGESQENEGEATKDQKNDENDDFDSKSNTESNLINEEVTSHIDEIYTEIEEIVTERSEIDSKAVDPRPKSGEELTDSNDNDLVVARKESAIKKLLSVFKKKKSVSAILLNEPLRTGEGEMKQEDLAKTGSQQKSKTCILI